MGTRNAESGTLGRGSGQARLFSVRNPQEQACSQFRLTPIVEFVCVQSAGILGIHTSDRLQAGFLQTPPMNFSDIASAIPSQAVTQIDGLPFPKLASGKVREIFDLGDALLIAATDRLSAFD